MGSRVNIGEITVERIDAWKGSKLLRPLAEKMEQSQILSELWRVRAMREHYGPELAATLELGYRVRAIEVGERQQGLRSAYLASTSVASPKSGRPRGPSASRKRAARRSRRSR